MTEIVRRARLFLGSYVLLFVLLAIRFQTPWLEIVCGATHERLSLLDYN